MKDQANNLWIQGDLCQMGTQARFLLNRGFELEQSNVYRIVAEKDKKRALQLIWDFKIEGYWHYKTLYLEYEICTAEEFSNRLKG